MERALCTNEFSMTHGQSMSDVEVNIAASSHVSFECALKVATLVSVCCVTLSDTWEVEESPRHALAKVVVGCSL